MPDNCENWLSLVNSCDNYARQTCEIYQVVSYSMDFKAPKELWNPQIRQHLSNVILFGTKDL